MTDITTIIRRTIIVNEYLLKFLMTFQPPNLALFVILSFI